MAIFIFFDESGNLDFSASGTEYYFFGALTTRNPMLLSQPLSDLKYNLIDEGLKIECFHASEDRQVVRDQVFDQLVRVGEFEYDCVIIEKRKLDPLLHAPTKFYPQYASDLLREIFRRYDGDTEERIVVITDTIPVKKTRKAVEKTFLTYISQELSGRPYTVLHHRSASHSGLQAADYLNWAIHKKWTHGEMRPYDKIKHLVQSEFEILEAGKEFYY